MFELLNANEEMMLEDKYIKFMAKRNSNEIVLLNKIFEDLTSFDNCLNNKDLLKAIPKEQIKILIKNWDEYKNNLPRIITFVESNEMWEQFDVFF
jgi:hypothetical protein